MDRRWATSDFYWLLGRQYTPNGSATPAFGILTWSIVTPQLLALMERQHWRSCHSVSFAKDYFDEQVEARY
ncbi:MAG TPA: hypothetical protein VMW80_00880 [Candidatus Dormibacteraeota bacterium]|nr:hypothetical protein [Candidatus Dormibacteraeota bacterium]